MKFFARKRKKLIIFGILLLASVIVCGLGLKYLPINKLLSVRSTSESDFAGVQQISGSAPHSLFFDFEVAPGKTKPDGLYEGIAHSGKYSSRAFGKNSYAMAIERKAEEIGISNLKAVGWSAWVYVFPNDREVKASFVFAASNDPGVNVCWKGIGLSGPGIPRGKWFKISGYADISEIKFKPGYKVQIYFWNDSSTDILVDDYYVVFNGSSERRGDSALVDMTRNTAFTAGFNRPPFPVTYLKKEETGNQNSPYLVLNQNLKEGNLKPDEKIVAGNFLGPAGGLDEILVLGKGRKPELFTFCPGEKKFIKIQVNISPASSFFLTARSIWEGRFVKETNDQVLIEGEKEWILGKFEPVKDPCDQGDHPMADFTILWRSLIKDLKGVTVNDLNSVITGDFDGDQLTEILSAKGDGSWRMIRLPSGAGGIITAVAEGAQVTSWDKNNGTFTITPGRFINRLKQDLLLTVYIDRESRRQVYSLSRFNPVRAMFDPVFPATDHNPGKTIGLDTLQVPDQFFTGNFERTWKNSIFRFSREWRFDLKQIQFNDTTFEILRNIDFAGYPKDHNPKYYEAVRMIPGHFTDPSVSSFLVIGRNYRENPEGGPVNRVYQNKAALPDFISVYSLNQATRK